MKDHEKVSIDCFSLEKPLNPTLRCSLRLLILFDLSWSPKINTMKRLRLRIDACMALCQEKMSLILMNGSTTKISNKIILATSILIDDYSRILLMDELLNMRS